MIYFWVACTPLLGKNPTLDDNQVEDLPSSVDVQRIQPTSDNAKFFGKELHAVNDTLYISAPSEVSEIYRLELNNAYTASLWKTTETQHGHHLTGINQLFWSTPSTVRNSTGVAHYTSPQNLLEVSYDDQSHLLVLSGRSLYVDSNAVLETQNRASLLGFCQGKALLYSPFGEHDIIVYNLAAQQLITQRQRTENTVRQSIECFKFDEQWTWAIAGDGRVEVLDLTSLESLYTFEFEDKILIESLVSPAPGLLLIGAPSSGGTGAVYELRTNQSNEITVKFSGTAPRGEFGSSIYIDTARNAVFVSAPMVEQGEVWRFPYE